MVDVLRIRIIGFSALALLVLDMIRENYLVTYYE